MTEQIAWEEETFASHSDVAAFAREAREAFPELDLSRDVSWLSLQGDCALRVMTVRKDGRLLALAPMQVHTAHLRFRLGEVTVARRRVERYALEREPLVRDLARASALEAFFEGLAARLNDGSAVFLRGVPENSTMHALLSKRRSKLKAMFNVVPHGPVYLRCRIHWEGSFERYLGSLSKVTRKDLRRTLKKAESEFGSEWRLERFTRVEDVPRFVQLASDVSAKTYQRRLLGEGITDSPEYRALLATAARDGRVLGHVLSIRGEPAAFHLSLLDSRCLYMVEGGYDPKWRRHQIGIWTFLLMLKDLEVHHLPVSLLDYSHGGGLYKERTSQIKTQERHYYLTRRTAAGTAVAIAMRTTDGVSLWLGQMLDRFRIKEWVKRQIRRAKSWCAGTLALNEMAACELAPLFI